MIWPEFELFKKALLVLWHVLDGERNRLVKEASVQPSGSLGEALMSGTKSTLDYIGQRPGLVPLAFGGAALLREALKKGVKEQGQHHSFHQALHLYPDLKNEPIHRLKGLYATAVQVAPTVATNPHILGSFMRSASKYTDMNISAMDLKPLAELETLMKGVPERRKLETGFIPELWSAGKARALGDFTGATFDRADAPKTKDVVSAFFGAKGKG